MPVCTSSKISSRPCLSHSSRKRAQERRRHDAHAALALIGSIRMARGLRADRLLDRLEIAERHLVEASTGGPKPSRYFLLPAAASVASVRPWNAPSKVMMR